MRVLGASVLAFEAIVVLLAIPAAIGSTDRPTPAVIAGGVVIALALIINAALLGDRRAYAVGWGLQAVVILCGLVVPAMWVLGAVFTALWWLALRLGRQGDEARKRRDAAGG